MNSLQPDWNDTDLEIQKKRQKVREAIQILRCKSVKNKTASPYQAPLVKKIPKVVGQHVIDKMNVAIQDMDLPRQDISPKHTLSRTT